MTTQQKTNLQNYLIIANMGVLSWALITLVTIYRDSAVDHERIDTVIKVNDRQDGKDKEHDEEFTRIWAVIDKQAERLNQSKTAEQEERPKKY